MPTFKHINGYDELAQALRAFPEKFTASAMRGGLRAGGTIMADEVRRTAPVGPPSTANAKNYGGRLGLLRDSVRIRTSLRGGWVKATITAGGKVKGGGDAFYALMVEYGTRAHIILSKKGGSLYINGFFASMVNHPGATARPFMRPALLSKADATLTGTGEYIRRRLQARDISSLDAVEFKVEDVA